MDSQTIHYVARLDAENEQRVIEESEAEIQEVAESATQIQPTQIQTVSGARRFSDTTSESQNQAAAEEISVVEQVPQRTPRVAEQSASIAQNTADLTPSSNMGFRLMKPSLRRLIDRVRTIKDRKMAEILGSIKSLKTSYFSTTPVTPIGEPAEITRISEVLFQSDRLAMRVMNSETTTLEDVRSFFEDYGIQVAVDEIRQQQDSDDDEIVSLCFPTFSSPDDLKKAIDLDGSLMPSGHRVLIDRVLNSLRTVHVVGNFEDGTPEKFKKDIKSAFVNYGVLSVYVPPNANTRFAYLLLGGKEGHMEKFRNLTERLRISRKVNLVGGGGLRIAVSEANMNARCLEEEGLNATAAVARSRRQF